MTDNRKKIRRQTSGYYIVYDRNTDEMIGRILDLSESGAMMITAKEMPVPCHRECRMHLPERIKGKPVIAFDLQSKWCRKNNRFDWYETGYEFVNITAETEEIIRALTADWKLKASHRPACDQKVAGK
jgi:hypothetical protein